MGDILNNATTFIAFFLRARWIAWTRLSVEWGTKDENCLPRKSAMRSEIWDAPRTMSVASGKGLNNTPAAMVGSEADSEMLFFLN